MYASKDGPPWPVWVALAGNVGVGLSVLSALFCAFALIFRLRVARSWIVATVALFVVSVATVGLLTLLMPVLPSTDAVR